MIVIGDVHGCFDTLKALLEKLPEDEICFVGDLIDRGPKSKDVVELVKSRGYNCVAGNHERMMIEYWDFYHKRKELYRMWEGNGGFECRMSYFEKPENDNSYHRGIFNEKLFEEHVKWMKDLPVYAEFEDIKNDEGRHLVVSHSHVCNVWGDQYGSARKLNNFIETVLWGRPRKLNQKRVRDIYNIIGHTPQFKVRIRDFYANVDTGCFYKGNLHNRNPKKQGMFHLTALQFPSMKVWTQECIDDVKW